MESHTETNTVLVWTKNKEIIGFTSEIAQELNLKIYYADIETDLLAIPCFMMFVDTEKLRDDFLSDFNEIAKHMDSGKQSIVVIGKRLMNLPFHVKPFVINAKRNITKEYIYKLVVKARQFKQHVKQDIFKKRINRIIFIYKLLDEGKVIITSEMCDLFETSDRTLRRDIKVLRDVCDKEIRFDKDSGYYFG